mgnify:CR=1 FL=1
MLFNLIAALMSGVLGASVAYALYRLSNRRLSRAIIPFAMALGMIGYNVWNEMSWYSRTSAALPNRFVVIEDGPPVSSPISPWTYIVPRIDKFRVLDTQSVQPLPKSDGRYLAKVHDIERYLGSRDSSVIVDCGTKEQAEITAATSFNEDGLPSNVAWGKIAPVNHIAGSICKR